ncbi:MULTISPECIES: ABC transporter permease [unclassified Crossiella]|uniref:ABC transporter permease n=1 Tax=unclassified Crossiella TaxID=2620835 RepID=UPI001FFEB38D|nr:MULTISPECIES: ABC transporter permease [unclassified Crossiella]MCK2236374.1 ABC transporter permease [Crossiella sp. S99.2]MCK2250041.1 ABC transporter permease [Crossiella sp. S99.1]
MKALVLRTPAVGPALALLAAVLIFSLTTDTFATTDNLSLVVQQSLVIGTLALGQTLVILTSGIDLANAAIAVLGTLLMAQLVLGGTSAPLALLIGILVAIGIAAVTGGVVTGISLPPFIVTLGMLTIVTAAARIYAGGQSYPVTDELLTFLGTRQYLFGYIEVTVGMGLALVMYLIAWYALTRTAWGRHVYAVGNDIEAARLSGIKVRRTVLSVYLVAGLVYGLAAWQALGRVPNADPNAFQTGNLDSITAVVLGGTSLFGGRGSVLGTLVGALIVAVLRSGLTQAGIDSLYQDVATGVLVIVAVAVDRFSRGRQA